MLVFAVFVGIRRLFCVWIFVCLLGSPVPVTGFTGDAVVLVSLRVKTGVSKVLESLAFAILQTLDSTF